MVCSVEILTLNRYRYTIMSSIFGVDILCPIISEHSVYHSVSKS
jgi:hypothetical protein